MFWILIGFYTNISIYDVFNNIKPIILYDLVSLLFYNAVGLICGGILGNILNGFLAYICSALLFFMSSGFGKVSPSLSSPCNMSFLPSIFTPIKINEFFYLTIKLWTFIGIILLIIYIICEFIKCKDKKAFLLVPVICLLTIPIYKIYMEYEYIKPSKINSFDSLYYNDFVKDDLITLHLPEDDSYLMNDKGHQFQDESKLIEEKVNGDDIGIDVTSNQYVFKVRKSIPYYTVEEYSMEIDLQENFNNKCIIKIKRNDMELKTLKFSFYNKSKIESLKVNGIPSNYNKDASNIYIDIPEEVKDENIIVELHYSSYIYSYVGNFAESDFVTDSAGYLSGNFPWYPKILNDEKEKYNIKVKCKTDNIYSNLEIDRLNDELNINGESKDLVLFYGDLKEVKKDDYTIVGPRLLMENEKSLDNLIYNIKLGTEDYEIIGDYQYFDRIFITPYNVLPSDSQYDNLILWSESN